MDVILNKTKSCESTMMRDVFCSALMELAEKDDRIVALDADLIGASGMKPFQERFPSRMIQCGIQEANMVGVAAGLAAVGKRPYAHSFAPFVTRRVMDQLFISSAYARLPITVIGTDPGVAAAFNGGTHMPFEDMAAVCAIPTMTAVEVSDAVQLKALVPQINELEVPCYLRLYRKTPRRVYMDGSGFTLGKGVVCREGTDLSIIASGLMVSAALDAAELLAGEGIRARVVDMFTWKPIDSELISDCAGKTGAIVTAENHNVMCGLGAAVAREMSLTVPVPMEMVGVQDRFGEVGTEDFLKERLGLTPQVIADKARKVVLRK